MTLKILQATGQDDLAQVFVGETNDAARIEFVESVQPPKPIDKKLVYIVSTLKGCPIQCPICDAGGRYHGKLSADEILAQIDYLIQRRFKSNTVPTAMLKIQFARMGDPAFNPAVLEVLKQLPQLYDIPGLTPSVSTVAPHGCAKFVLALKEIKDRMYDGGRFQMQFSVHTTCDTLRRTLVPAKTLSLAEIGALGHEFYSSGDRKVTLNFAAVQGFPVDAEALRVHCAPETFIIKVTPVNPTHSQLRNGLHGQVDPGDPASYMPLITSLKNAGYDVILSIGEQRENEIGSNCGMYVTGMEQGR